MTLARFSKEQRTLPVEGKRWLVHLHRRWKEVGGAIAALVVKPTKGQPLPSAQMDKVPLMVDTLFGDRRPFTTTIAEMRAIAGKPSWRIFWEPRPVQLSRKGPVFDAVLIARALACVKAAPNARVRVSVRPATRLARAEGYDATCLLIVGDDWRAVIASRTPKVDPRPALVKPKRVTPRATNQKKGA